MTDSQRHLTPAIVDNGAPVTMGDVSGHMTPNGGFVTDDGRMTPKAREQHEADLQTAAARRRARLIAEDKTKLTAYEREGETFYIATWGRNDRQLFHEANRRRRNGEGEFVLAESDLSSNEKFTLMVLCRGVFDENGEPFFTADEVIEYSDNVEDNELLADLFPQIIEANPLIFPPDEIKIVSADSTGDGTEADVEKKDAPETTEAPANLPNA